MVIEAYKPHDISALPAAILLCVRVCARRVTSRNTVSVTHFQMTDI